MEGDFNKMLAQLASHHASLQLRLEKTVAENKQLNSQVIQLQALSTSRDKGLRASKNSNCCTQCLHPAPAFVDLRSEDVRPCVTLTNENDDQDSVTQSICHQADSTADQQELRIHGLHNQECTAGQREFMIREVYNVSDEDLRFLRPKRFDLQQAMALMAQKQKQQLAFRMFQQRVMHNEEEDIERCSGFIMHPQSSIRLFWDLVGLGLLAYDFIATPLGLLIQNERFWMSMTGWMINGFWSLDILLNFFTGFYDGTVFVKQLHRIALHYAKHWLILDVIVILPEWVTLIISQHTGATDNFIGLRLLKVIRMFRLLRTVKLRRLIHYVLASIESDLLMTFLHAFMVLAMIFGCLHVIACVWFVVGDTEDGWVQVLNMKTASTTNRWVVAMHRDLSSLQGTSWPINALTHLEHAYSVCIMPI